ncbi:hypothetical protein GCM10010964_40420 [Caldovatus sediminis]|uniref:Uncharacterized protein n=2 Tax=Caldovatus sediminis TaxID=2041189 RepID=A0A8J3EF11_9PROT|nr:hypothetical protein GCM10010964_40420 [Caldovatus sediminis]
MRGTLLRHGWRTGPTLAAPTRAALRLLLMLLPAAGGCAGAPEAGRDTGDAAMASTAAMAERLPSELLGLRRYATERFVLPRLGSGLAIRYAPESGGALASVVLVARDESGIAGDDPRQPAAEEEFGRMFIETLGLAHPAAPRHGTQQPEEQFLVALHGQPLVRCAALSEAAADGQRLNGLRCLGVAQARFIRVFLTTTPGTLGLREAAGFAALVTALLQDGAAASGDPGAAPAAPPAEGPAAPGPALTPGADDGPWERGQRPLLQGRGPVYRI